MCARPMTAETSTPLGMRTSIRWRASGTADARRNLASEEAIFWSQEGTTVRLWENERSVIIGRGQYATYETDIDYCLRERIPVVRRFTGGGAVYNGPGNLNWSIFATSGTDSGRIRLERDVVAIFRMASSVVIDALGRLGIGAWLAEPNRIVTAEGKVSGMAAFLTRGRLLCHGTLLLDADIEEAQRLTTPRETSAQSRYVRSRQARMANLGISADSFGESMRDVILEDDCQLVVADRPETAEVESTEKLMAKYCSDSWNLGDPFVPWRENG